MLRRLASLGDSVFVTTIPFETLCVVRIVVKIMRIAVATRVMISPDVGLSIEVFIACRKLLSIRARNAALPGKIQTYQDDIRTDLWSSHSREHRILPRIDNTSRTPCGLVSYCRRFRSPEHYYMLTPAAPRWQGVGILRSCSKYLAGLA